MPKFAANLSFLYQDLPFLDRFEAAAKDGFQAVEYLFPLRMASASPGRAPERKQVGSSAVQCATR